VAQVKETQITGIRFEVGIGDYDPDQMSFAISAVTRDNSETPVNQYRQDISDMVTVDDMAVLGPLIQRGIGRIMQDREISADDLAEGQAAHEQREADAADALLGAHQSMVSDVDAPVLPEVDPDLLSRQAAEEAARFNRQVEEDASRQAALELASTDHTAQTQEDA
jgi:hypothetical protein